MSANITNAEIPVLKNTSYELLEKTGSYISCMRVFLGYYGEIASVKKTSSIQHKKAINWVETELSGQILKKHIKEYHPSSEKKSYCENVLYLLRDKILIDLEEDGWVSVLFLPGSEQTAKDIIDTMKTFKKRRTHTTHISLLAQTAVGLTLAEAKIKKPKLDIALNYNDDLVSLHREIIKGIRKPRHNGLLLFHGTPGTGKSTYIRYLIHCQNKRAIFLPARIAGDLDSPELMGILIENPNSILVIEDAEHLLASRETNHNDGISMLLNLTDGLLGESIGTQVICTFNTHVANIDKALLRKGRLIAMYEFKALSAAKARILLQQMGVKKYIPLQPMTLAEIYNARESQFEFSSERKKIGFMADSN